MNEEIKLGRALKDEEIGTWRDEDRLQGIDVVRDSDRERNHMERVCQCK